MTILGIALQAFIQTRERDMDNKYLFAVVGGVFLFLWFWVGLQPYYAAEGGGIDTVYLFIAVLVLALGGGDSNGSDLISALTGSITGFIPKFIGLTIATIVGSFSRFQFSRSFPAELHLFLLDGVFQCFPGREFWNFTCFDLDGFTSLRIASHSGGALRDGKRSEPDKRNSSAFF